MKGEDFVVDGKIRASWVEVASAKVVNAGKDLGGSAMILAVRPFQNFFDDDGGELASMNDGMPEKRLVVPIEFRFFALSATDAERLIQQLQDAIEVYHAKKEAGGNQHSDNDH